MNQDRLIWITSRYTIESYLPADWPFRAKHVRDDGGKVDVIGLSKVELAACFRDEIKSWSQCDPDSSDLGDKIAHLVSTIRLWQSPQEAIEPRYLPPFLAPR